jgi:hypothetical protein
MVMIRIFAKISYLSFGLRATMAAAVSSIDLRLTSMIGQL